MTHGVTEACICCRNADCVDACPVACLLVESAPSTKGSMAG